MRTRVWDVRSVAGVVLLGFSAMAFVGAFLGAMLWHTDARWFVEKAKPLRGRPVHEAIELLGSPNWIASKEDILAGRIKFPDFDYRPLPPGLPSHEVHVYYRGVRVVYLYVSKDQIVEAVWSGAT